MREKGALELSVSVNDCERLAVFETTIVSLTETVASSDGLPDLDLVFSSVAALSDTEVVGDTVVVTVSDTESTCVAVSLPDAVSSPVCEGLSDTDPVTVLLRGWDEETRALREKQRGSRGPADRL